MNSHARLLRPDQQAAVEQFRHLKVGALFMGMGTGKTQTAVAILNTVEELDYLLWICPFATKGHIRQELTCCACRYPIEIIAVESISHSDTLFLALLHKLQEAKQACIVVDESIKMKNMGAKRTKRLLTLSSFSEYRLILNGSPITRNILDIYAQMRFLSPKILDMSFLRYRDCYASYKQYRSYGRVTKTVITGYANIDHLISRICPYVYQCDLHITPKRLYTTVHWFLTEKEQSLYSRLKHSLLSRLLTQRFAESSLIAIFQRLQHSYACAEDKFACLERIVTERSIVFCRFLCSQAAVQARFPKACVLTYGKGAFGLNLQEYNRIIYFDKTWDYAYREQSEARIYRLGQEEDCQYYDLTGNIGLEELIDQCIARKTSLVRYFKTEGYQAVIATLQDLEEKHALPRNLG